MNDILISPIRLSELESLILNQVRKALAEVSKLKLDAPKDELLTIEKCADLLSVSVPTVYGYVHKRQIPFMKRQGRLYFSKSELLEWVKSSRRMTIDEIKQATVESLDRQK